MEMIEDSLWCTNVVQHLKNKSLSPDVTLDQLKNKNREDLTAVDSILTIRALLREFEVKDEDIISACIESSRTDSIEWALCTHVANLYGESDYEFANSLLSAFNGILWQCKGFRTDWRFNEETIEWLMNAEHLLPGFGLKISFSPHKRNEPFEILLQDLTSGTILKTATFQYSKEHHEMRELITVINNMIKNRGLEFIDADDGGDSYVFILFESALLDLLNKKYGDVGRLVNWNKRIDNDRISY